MEERSDSESSNVVKQSKRALTRTFVHLEKPMNAAPSHSSKVWKALQDDGRVADVVFLKGHSAADIGRLLLASFPSLLGRNLKRLIFIKSYDSGHSMPTVAKGLLCGEELLRHYSSGGKKKKVYFLFEESGPSTATATAAPQTAISPQADLTADGTSDIPRRGRIPQVDLTQTTPPNKGAKTRRLLTKMAQSKVSLSQQDDVDIDDLGDHELIIYDHEGHNQAIGDRELREEPKLVGTIIEDFAYFGIESDTVKGEYTGRTQEVASVIHHVIQNCNVNLPPFVPHSLDELVWQAREAGAMCALFIISGTHKKEYIENLFKMLDSTVQQMALTCLFWVADRESAEGKKVQAKYGVGGDMPSMLVLVPSYVPQCVEIFNETNIGKKKVLEAFQTARGLCQALKEERVQLDNRRSLIKEQDKEFLVASHNTEGTCTSAEESENEVQFGPLQNLQTENLEDTVEDVNEETKKMPNKNKKKKKKKNKNKKRKNKGKQAEEPEEKKICPTDHENE